MGIKILLKKFFARECFIVFEGMADGLPFKARTVIKPLERTEESYKKLLIEKYLEYKGVTPTNVKIIEITFLK